MKTNTIQKCIRLEKTDIESTERLMAQDGGSFSDHMRAALRIYLQRRNETLNSYQVVDFSGKAAA